MVGASALLADLDDAQRAAVLAGPGPLLVVAGAGSGKTRVLTRRVARLVAEGEDPARILLLTFTQKAAREMVARIAALLDPGAARAIEAGTFHAVAARILRQFGDRIGLRRDFGLLDPAGAVEVLDEVLGEGPTGLGRMLPAPRVLLRILSLSLNADRPIAAVVERLAPRHGEVTGAIEGVLGRFCARKLELNALDYDDLLAHGHLLLTEDDSVRAALAERFRQVLVDEYQDTNPLQAALVSMIGSGHGNVTAVGDDAQAIYGFRGASVGHILAFEHRWIGSRRVSLLTNYRSTPAVVAVANAALSGIGRRLEKVSTAAPGVAAGPRPVFVRLADEGQEARFVAARARELVAAGVPLGEQAVLYRAHAHARALQLELGRQGLPFVLRSGPRMLERAHVRDLLAWLRAWVNPFDVPAWRRALRLQPGIGAAGADRLIGALFETGDPWRAIVDDVPGPGLDGRLGPGWRTARATLLAMAQAERPGAMVAAVLDGGLRAALPRLYPEDHGERAADLAAIARHAAQSGDVAGFLEGLALVDGFDADEAGDCLVLSSIHQAKGLEWTAVTVIGLAEGLFPAFADRRPGALDEERRLFYVAVTRARRHLHLCSPMGDGGVPRGISRFVEELPHTDPALVETWHVAES